MKLNCGIVLKQNDSLMTFVASCDRVMDRQLAVRSTVQMQCQWNSPVSSTLLALSAASCWCYCSYHTIACR